jgi:hypothetical protein
VAQSRDSRPRCRPDGWRNIGFSLTDPVLSYGLKASTIRLESSLASSGGEEAHRLRRRTVERPDVIETVMLVEEIFGTDIRDPETFSSPRQMADWLELRLLNWEPNKQAAALLRKLAKAQQRPEFVEGLDRSWQRGQTAAVIREIFRSPSSEDNSSNPTDLDAPVRAPLKPGPHPRSDGAEPARERDRQRGLRSRLLAVTNRGYANNPDKTFW